MPRAHLLAVLGSLAILPLTTVAVPLHVSPDGNDEAAGTREAPLRTLHRAQEAAREATKTVTGDVVVNLAAGIYRLDRTLAFTEADSGRKGKVIYRSADGLGKARVLGSMVLTGWQEHKDGIWKVALPEDVVFHTLYEKGKRAHKARFPNHVHQPDFPTARGPYLRTEDGCKGFERDKGTAWLTYAEADTPPVTDVTKMKIALYLRGKCDWMRTIYSIKTIDPTQRRMELAANRMYFGILARARYFLEDDLGFLDAPGEFYVDETSHTLYYKPMAEGHPDTLGIAAPVLSRLIQILGKSRNECVQNLRFEGLSLEETDGNTRGWWTMGHGNKDGALIWMRNTTGIEVRDCHLKNSGRSGIMLIGHNIGNRITGCWIEHMGLNGVTLCNNFLAPGGKTTEDRCARNLVTNCHIHNVGEVHCYAAGVNVFNAEDNEVSHCEVHDSVRYAVTVRGNTGAQYGPPVWTKKPQCKGNRIHHLRTYRCGQDSGDMGTLHCANLNNPDGGCVNTFEQITVADSGSVASVQDVRPDGIFLDWPKMSMDQIFRHVEIVRSQGKQVRSNRPENAASAQTTNVSWKPGFDKRQMEYDTIGLTDEFPAAYGGRPPRAVPPPAPRNLRATSPNHRTFILTWEPPEHTFRTGPQYTVYRDGKSIAHTLGPTFTDTRRRELTQYRYTIAAQDGDLCHLGPQSRPCMVRTPADRTAPVVETIWSIKDTNRVRVRFSKAMVRATILRQENYQFSPPLAVRAIRWISADCVELEVATAVGGQGQALTVRNVTDSTASHNALQGGAKLPVTAGGSGVAYDMQLTANGRLLDSLGGAGDAVLRNGAAVVPDAGPFGGPALHLDGEDDYAEASPAFNLGGDEFTIMAWVWREKNSTIILSKGNGFGEPATWSFGWAGKGKSDSVSLRNLNVFHSTAAFSVPLKKWVHVAFVRRGRKGLTYVNGKPSDGPHDLTDLAPLVNDHPLRIGRRAHEPNPVYFQGKLAHLRLLPHALSAEEVQAAAQPPGKLGK